MNRNLRSLARRRNGAAMILAIWTIGFVAIVLTVLCAAVTGEIRRSRAAAEDAQLRQLLLAGAEAARLQLHDSPLFSGACPINLPPALKDQGAQLTISIESAAATATMPADSAAATPGRWARLDATMPNFRMHESLHLGQRPGTTQWDVDRVITAGL